jgi:hypothetical protein
VSHCVLIVPSAAVLRIQHIIIYFIIARFIHIAWSGNSHGFVSGVALRSGLEATKKLLAFYLKNYKTLLSDECNFISSINWLNSSMVGLASARLQAWNTFVVVWRFLQCTSVDFVSVHSKLGIDCTRLVSLVSVNNISWTCPIRTWAGAKNRSMVRLKSVF